MSTLHNQIRNFKTHEPYATGKGESSIPFLKLIPKECKNVLVVGCGEGQEVQWLSKNGFKAVGVTNNPREASNGRTKLGADIRVYDMHDIKLNDKFDAIFASNVLEHSLAPYGDKQSA